MSTALDPPVPPKLWDVYQIAPWRGDGAEDRILRHVIAFELVNDIWFFTKADLSVTAINLRDSGYIQVRPA